MLKSAPGEFEVEVNPNNQNVFYIAPFLLVLLIFCGWIALKVEDRQSYVQLERTQVVMKNECGGEMLNGTDFDNLLWTKKQILSRRRLYIVSNSASNNVILEALQEADSGPPATYVGTVWTEGFCSVKLINYLYIRLALPMQHLTLFFVFVEHRYPRFVTQYVQIACEMKLGRPTHLKRQGNASGWEMMWNNTCACP